MSDEEIYAAHWEYIIQNKEINKEVDYSNRNYPSVSSCLFFPHQKVFKGD
jgi:hypothetical protein